MPEINDANALDKINAVIATLDDSPTAIAGSRGIVICAGGIRYFTCAWVCINMLRKMGCTLPIELWHLGPREINDGMRELLSPLDVRCVDAYTVRERRPVRILNGWELKPYAILYSNFSEVIALDADNVPLIDPAFLFETPQYAESGAIFWPDFGRLAESRSIWKLAGVAFRDEPEFESGQIVIDKRRCWKPLHLTMWMNEHSDFWYRHIHGDKETFHICWRKLGQNYAMPSRGIHALSATMCQHDFHGHRIFQHRNMAKWTIGENRRIPGFQEEEVCLGFLAELRRHWRKVSGMAIYVTQEKSETERNLAQELINEKWTYERVGHDVRTMEFLPNGAIGLGAAALEIFWNLHLNGTTAWLDIMSEELLTCRLHLDSDRIWRGRWERFERMGIEVKPLQPSVPGGLLKRDRDYSQFGEQASIIEFLGRNSKGYFLDIGASDGVSDSNTRAMFERGWSGTLVEPVPEEYWRLEDNYAGSPDIQLVNAAVSDRDGFGEMWICRRIKGSNGRIDNRNTLDPDFANSGASADNPAMYDLREIRTITVETLLKRIGRAIIDCLCVDTEGLDFQIIRGLLERGIRPRLLVWEADKKPPEVIAVERLLTDCGMHEVFRTQANRGWGR